MLSHIYRHGSLALLILRVVIGIIFLYHGYQKWALWSGAPDGMSSGILLMMRTLSILEPLAGLALILGVMTQYAALLLAIIMLGGIYFKIKVMGVGFASAEGTGWEFDLILFASSSVLFFYGAGLYSFDASMQRESM